MLILKMLTAQDKNVELATATGYMTSFYSLFLFAVGSGLTDAIGIYCSQAWGSKKPEDINRMYLMFKQSMLIMAMYYLAVITPLALFVETFLVNKVGVSVAVSATSQTLVIYCLPGLFVRSLTDVFKSYAQAQEITVKLGYFTLFNLAIVPFYSYLFIITLKLEALGFGLCLLTYECGNVIIALVIFKKYMKPECRTTQLALSDKFGWFLCESTKNSATVFHIYLAYESVTLIISKLHDDS